MMKPKHWLAILCATVMLLSLAACSGAPTATSQAPEASTPAAASEAPAPEAPSAEASSAASEATSTPADASSAPMAKYDPPIDFTTVISLSDKMQNFIGTKPDVLTNNNWINGYKNDLGINVTYLWSVPGAQYEQKLNSQIAANDLPDVVNVNATQLKTLVDSGMVYDMTDVFAKNIAPFTQQMMDADNNVALSQATFNGKLMALPSVSGNKDGVNMLWIRKDWLDKLGLKTPKTIDELMALAKAFTENDPDSNGKADTYGIAMNNTIYSGGLNDMTGLFESFGVNPNGWIEGSDGKAAFGLIQPQIKDGLALLAQMYKDGYMDKEFNTKDNSKVAEDLVAGKVGMFFGQHWVPFWPLQDGHNLNPNADWIAVAIPSKDGTPAMSMIHGSAGGFYAVNVDTKYPEAAVKLYNYNYMKDCALSPEYDRNFHIPGTEEAAHPEASYEWSIVKTFYPMQNLFIHRGVMKYLAGDKTQLENSWINDNALASEKYLADAASNGTQWSAYRWSGPEGSGFSVVDSYDTKNLMLQDLYIMGSTDGMVQYNTTLNQLALETFTKIIMGQVSVDEFDNFVKQWKSLGGDQITQEVNKAIGK